MPHRLFHATWNTYGSWLPGDPRGFRDHDHRIHSTGTYKRPPPEGEHTLLHQHARRIRNGDPIALDTANREVVLRSVILKCHSLGIDLRAVAVALTHVHLLAVLDDTALGGTIGKLKRASSHALRATLPGTVWSKRCDTRLISHDQYHDDALAYILRHASEDAVVWARGMPIPQSGA